MIRSCGPWFVFAATLALGAPAHAYADADEVDPYALSPEQLFEATVVSASRSEESVWEAPAAVYVITASDIERAGVSTIPEALRLAPGVQVARIATSGWAVSIRGFNGALANKLLVMIDGREIYDPLFSGVYWDIQDTVIEDIERIEIVRGPGGSLWGANAVNGIINIITRDAAETHGALLSATTGSTEHAGLTARYGGVVGDATHWRVFGRAFERGAQETLAGADDNSDWRAYRGGFRIDSDLGTRDALTVQGDIYRSETGQYRLAPSFSAPFATLERESITAEGGNVLARWTRTFDNDARLTTQAYIDLTRRAQRTLEDRRTTFDLDIQYDFPTFGMHDVIAGVRFRDSTDEITPTEIIRSADDEHHSQLLSAFVQDQIQLSEAWRLTVGSKFDDNDYTGFEIQPSARLQWMGDRQMAWGAVSRAVRTPSELEREFNILFAAAFTTDLLTVEILPNPDFDSEEVAAYELGYRRQWTDALSMDVALFHNEYTGVATLSAIPGFLPAVDPPRIIILPLIFTNDTDATTEGIELVFDWRARDDLNLSFAYSFLDMELNGPPAVASAEAAEGQSPRNQANVRAQWDATDRLSIDATLFYVDELPNYGVEDYVRADLHVGYRLTDTLQFELVGQNLFDDKHREFTPPGDVNAATIDRSVFGRLTWRH
jgi:iron complex outermembrane recepter protein